MRKAWEKVAEREGLSKDALEEATWGFLGFVLGRNYNLVTDMSKARKLGWTGYVDTWDTLSGSLMSCRKRKFYRRHSDCIQGTYDAKGKIGG